MRIIKPGKVVRPVWAGSCRECGCEFECEDADFVTVTDRWAAANGYNRTELMVPCPTCGIRIPKWHLKPVPA